MGKLADHLILGLVALGLGACASKPVAPVLTEETLRTESPTPLKQRIIQEYAELKEEGRTLEKVPESRRNAEFERTLASFEERFSQLHRQAEEHDVVLEHLHSERSIVSESY